jgi:3-deoxy-D-manno-octulosonic-acid transferase
MGLWLYAALAHGWRLLAWAGLWWRGRRVPAYRLRWRERAGRVAYPAAFRGSVVVHAASMGEVTGALPLVERWLAADPALRITFTCSSPTASELIGQRLSAYMEGAPGATHARVHHVYLPFDTPGAMRRFLHGVQPRLLVLMETELWPQLLVQAERLAVPVVVANGRLSARSARNYRRWGFLTRGIVRAVDGWWVQDEDTRVQLLTLGVAPARMWVTGSLKVDTPVPPHTEALAARLREVLRTHAQTATTLGQGRAGLRPICVAASTHEGEEAALLTAWRELLTDSCRAAEPAQQALLVLAPRHPQRFQEVAQLLEEGGWRYVRQTAVMGETPWPSTAQAIATPAVSIGTPTQSPDAPAKPPEVWLLDTMGDLSAWFSLADVVFMGGSLIPRGGHNPLEAVRFGVPVLSGPHVFNFDAIFRTLASEGVAQLLPAGVLQEMPASVAPSPKPTAALAQSLQRLLGDSALQAQLRPRALQVYAALGGACERTLPGLQALLARRPPSLPVQGAGFAGSEHALLNPEFFSTTGPWFNARHWQDQQAVEGQASGRATVWMVKQDTPAGTQRMVLRHYQRGGAMGRLLGDRFLWEPALQSRALAEFRLLQRMRSWGLPVPVPCAARQQRSGLWYRADILVERLPHTESLFDALRQRALPEGVWQRAGQAIAQLHASGVYHSDLNCHNLLVDSSQRVWIIDFDKCGLRPFNAQPDWRAANMARLKRSLDKEARLHGPQHWHGSEAGWQWLVDAYEKA